MSGRATKRKVMNLGTNIDGAVRRIEYAYDSLGRQTTVTQYDAVSAGNVVDQVAFTYTDWGLPFEAKNDHDSAVGGSYLYQIDYTYAKATTGRNTIRRTGMTLPSGNVLTYQYSSTSDLHDDELSRVTRVQDGAVDLARYYYNGAGHVVGTDLPEADVWSRQYSGSTFPDLDRFNRPIKWRWTKDLATDIDFYDRDCIFDENSNVTVFDEHVHTGFDVKYTIDDLDRLIDEQRGTYSTGTITSETLQQTWTLDQVGNWPAVVLDLTNDGDGFDAGETDEERTHNDVNELTDRDIENDGDAMYDDILYDLTYDANGNLTDDGENYEYVYDAFNRLRKVKNTSTQALVAEYRYNGLNYRITSHEDTDGNGTVNGSDTILHFAYDERWRIVAVFEDSSSDPHEEFVHHNAGDSGFGTSSYIDAVVLRDRDADGDVNHDLEERIYYCQNWRHDVVALVTDTGKLVEQVRYDAYGGMFALPTGDTDSDGDWDSTDDNNITTSISYGVEKDANLDGAVSAADVTHSNSITSGYQTLGRGVLSSTGVVNVVGYASYTSDRGITGGFWHVRHRVFDSTQGRWLTRDPWGYVITANLYEYAPSLPQSWIDPYGLFPVRPRGPMKVPPHNPWNLTFPLVSPGGPGTQGVGSAGGETPGSGDGGSCPTCPLSLAPLPPMSPSGDPLMSGIEAVGTVAVHIVTKHPVGAAVVGVGLIIYALWPNKKEWAHVAGDICRKLSDIVKSTFRRKPRKPTRCLPCPPTILFTNPIGPPGEQAPETCFLIRGTPTPPCWCYYRRPTAGIRRIPGWPAF